MSSDSDWSRIAGGQLNTYKLARRGEELLEYLARRGLKIPPGNRIQLAIKQLDRLNRGALDPCSDDPEAQRVAGAAIRALWESFLIVHAVRERSHSPSTFPNSALADLLKGALVSEGESKSQARDKSFELYVAAQLSLAGASIELAEPDLRLQYFSETLGIAAKRARVASEEALEGQFRAAASQLGAHRLRGLVALQLDPWLDALVVGEDLDAVGSSFNASVRRAHERLGETGSARIIGALFVGNRVAWRYPQGAKPYFEWATPIQWLFLSDSEPEERSRTFFEQGLFPRLRAGLSRALPYVCSSDSSDVDDP